MHILLLGTAAGGALPQWNCGCPNCIAARAGDQRLTPRTQSSIAVSHDGERWVLINASPDVRIQFARNPALHPKALRHAPVEAVMLTNADIDHALGLFVLRENGAPPIYATKRVKRALVDGLRVVPVLAAYGAVEVRTVWPGETIDVTGRGGEALGVSARAFTVASKPPPYMLPLLQAHERDDLHAGDTVGYELFDTARPDETVVYVPGVKVLDEALRARCAKAKLVLIDGTCFTNNELVTLGCSQKTALDMGHCPLDGDDGMLAFLASLPASVTKVLVHMNNTNPVLQDGSAARQTVEASGVVVGADGMRWSV